MRTRALFLSFMALTLFGSGAGSAGAGEGTRCTFAYAVTLSPGLSVQPSTGTVSTDGPTGKLDCDGPVNGREARGAGTIGIDGHYGLDGGDSCASGFAGGGDGAGSSTLTVPTRGEDQRVTDTYALTYGQPSSRGVISGTFHGDRYSGTFSLYPLEGDCVTSPITRALLTGEGVLR
jgi:hypothetical protein